MGMTDHHSFQNFARYSDFAQFHLIFQRTPTMVHNHNLPNLGHPETLNPY